MYPWLSNVQQQYAQQQQQGRLHHAHLLYGAEGVGKGILAEQLCKALLCEQAEQMHPCGQCKGCKLIAAGTHPDLLMLSGEGSSIGVDAIRAISDFVQHSAQQGGAKCVIIPNAQRMTVAASNALLKTLEEPNNHCYLWLLSPGTANLSATILSRCAKQQISVQDDAHLDAWLQQYAHEAIQQPFAVHFKTQPLLLRQWQENDELGQIQTLYQALYEQRLAVNEQKLVDILTQNSQYIAIFRLFVSQFLLHKSQQGLSFAAFERCYKQLHHFSEQVTQTPGLNMTLALAQLLRVLKQELG
ncbi:DNA polymerase III subunit delta' [Pseudoalteromonas sp. BDTF-M6]|uniref:DNA polymerase III subunit delta' n=1 Tax=Pseudoalteromonas sp. BDTF-M6 TaxID=2796132 RepID=UPI001BAFE5F2|nr:DNA polymerase III subunit delta' [Pseudoalteromonas sp. BDTF-M6]MBS3798727.1 DNA polymerase III subunit delta' [Pseudoalteromonas sp. BDTF-M6]